MCFADIPRVTYDRSHQVAAATAMDPAEWPPPTGIGGSAVDEVRGVRGEKRIAVVIVARRFGAVAKV